MNLQNFLKKRALFVLVDGWISLRSGKVVSEAASVCSSDINHWMENVWPDIIRNDDEKHIFNADETDSSSDIVEEQGEPGPSIADAKQMRTF
ncbi:hypothetical protein AVEN_129847-1 [Araneus ventricosus]|uniref:Uncharacterized protein n=1 Tax=Araneus ventricosus TaxID=182803 RepID=A0A4Y2K799_ARAVE|nr:hypothetical protein AVEN_129847-1 [Araneus ventricosus]